ncbi:filament-like plant protein 4 isoform X2 [Rhodamnia argentea]|uniref:Filament-like plant protein 4 isoform X2 n=1 Tax=Rhodamnia argentea TaxID=178133 RepID=A0A8B8NNI2_9MYRT|nr:filament-like plant protein 4 isoform X2 [Rhodamnia argentea]
MDHRGWPWKKKSLGKNLSDKDVAPPDPAITLSKAASLGHEDCVKVSYVQIPLDSYKHLSGLEGHVTTLESQVTTLESQVTTLGSQVKDLKEKLSAAYLEISLKENLVKQHAKVAEEAVSGWEKADAEALALRQQLESTMLLKLTAEDRASHLDGALKECMRQTRNVKEESERNLQEVIRTKAKQWNEMKLGFEAQVAELDCRLLQATAENAALSRSLQDHIDTILSVNEEKSLANLQIEVFKQDIKVYEKDMSSLKYELHMVSKELDIRNQEKNISMKSAEALNHRHLEDVKKISKLEAECQRLRGLVRKKLPGPAALAQMKLEVGSSGRISSDNWLRKNTASNPSSRLPCETEISFDRPQLCYKESDFLSKHLLATEEESKMLKETLAARDSELQALRNMCAKTVGRLKSLGAQIQAVELKRSPESNMGLDIEDFSSQIASVPPSASSTCEDGIEEEGSSSESWGPHICSMSQLKSAKSIDKSDERSHESDRQLMDDFLEMEKLACSSDDTFVNSSSVRTAGSASKANIECVAPADGTNSKDANLLPKQDPRINSSVNQEVPYACPLNRQLKPHTEDLQLPNLLSKIGMVIESHAPDVDVGKVLLDIKHAVQIPDSPLLHSVGRILEEAHPSDRYDQRPTAEDKVKTAESVISAIPGSPMTSNINIRKQNLEKAVSQIHEFVFSLGKEAALCQDFSSYGHGLEKMIQSFSTSVENLACNNLTLADFVIELSDIVGKASELKSGIISYTGCEGDTSDGECIDKVALLESKVIEEKLSGNTFADECGNIPSTSNIEDYVEGFQEENTSSQIGSKVASYEYSKEGVNLLKSQKEDIVSGISRCTDLETTKLQLLEKEKLLTGLKLQLESCQNSHSLAEVQLKCMTESYKSLEMQAHDLEAEVKLLHGKIEKLEEQLAEEKHHHQETQAKCEDLQQKIKRKENCTTCSSSAADLDIKSKQEIAAAAQKLAECQDTIYLLSKQLTALQPHPESKASQI